MTIVSYNDLIIAGSRKYEMVVTLLELKLESKDSLVA
jgi:hypothetical protein